MRHICSAAQLLEHCDLLTGCLWLDLEIVEQRALSQPDVREFQAATASHSRPVCSVQSSIRRCVAPNANIKHPYLPF